VSEPARVSDRSFRRLFARCARVIPAKARANQRQSAPGTRAARSPATTPETSVIGRTAARETTIQRVTASIGPAGGLVVRRA
jgi:hypothetical protein